MKWEVKYRYGPSNCAGEVSRGFRCSEEARQDDLYCPSEQDEILSLFTEMLRAVTNDGGKKRAAGLKPSWKTDRSHEAAIFSHLYKWQRSKLDGTIPIDPDSGVHTLVHGAWRMLAVAYQEMCAPQ